MMGARLLRAGVLAALLLGALLGGSQAAQVEPEDLALQPALQPETGPVLRAGNYILVPSAVEPAAVVQAEAGAYVMSGGAYRLSVAVGHASLQADASGCCCKSFAPCARR